MRATTAVEPMNGLAGWAVEVTNSLGGPGAADRKSVV